MAGYLALATTTMVTAAQPIGASPLPHQNGWDQHSLIIDGKRTTIWSGEFHPFRLPSLSE